MTRDFVLDRDYAYNDLGCGGDEGVFNMRWAASQSDDFNVSPKTCQATTNEYDTLIEYYYTSAGTTTASSKKTCFAGTEMVNLESGELKPISDVVVGDSILSANARGETKFSKVLYVPHTYNNEYSEIVRLQLSSGNDIKLTGDHIVAVQPLCTNISQSELRWAKSVEVGMCLVTMNGLDPVASVSTMVEKGLYSAIAEEEFIVVNGIIVSPFAHNHVVTNAYYNVLRWLPLPDFMSSFLFSNHWVALANEYFCTIVSGFISL
jgi:hypothetical protein